jgi:predicted CoA-binding protein
MAILTDTPSIQQLLARVRRVAVLGIKMEPWEPAYYVPAHSIQAGLDVIPVPVYYPDVREIMNRPVYRRLIDIPPPIDLVNVFRRSEKVPEHLEDMLAARPAAVWMQSGIANDEVAEALSAAGIDVVQNRCLMVELQRMGRAAG